MRRIPDMESLSALYGTPGPASLVKETPHVTPHYARMIEASPFCTLATVGPEGLDCSPRGDRPGFVRVHDPRTLLMPDRRGNDRIDSLQNIMRDPRVALCFLIPGSTSALRVNGEAFLTDEPDLLASFEMEGKQPRTVIVIEPRAVYFQCARAVKRARLWEADARIDPASLPSAGEILAALSENRVGGPDYDAKWTDRAQATMW